RTVRPVEALERVVVVNRFPAVEVFRAGSVLIALVLAVYLLWRIEQIIFLLFLAILLATAIEPLVERLRRGPFTRGSGTFVVYSAIIATIALPLFIFGP